MMNAIAIPRSNITRRRNKPPTTVIAHVATNDARLNGPRQVRKMAHDVPSAIKNGAARLMTP